MFGMVYCCFIFGHGISFGSVLQYEVILKVCAIKFKNSGVNIGADHASSKVPFSKLKHMSSFHFFKIVIISFISW